jgi:hypothetical protein
MSQQKHALDFGKKENVFNYTCQKLERRLLLKSSITNN